MRESITLEDGRTSGGETELRGIVLTVAGPVNLVKVTAALEGLVIPQGGSVRLTTYNERQAAVEGAGLEGEPEPPDPSSPWCGLWVGLQVETPDDLRPLALAVVERLVQAGLEPEPLVLIPAPALEALQAAHRGRPWPPAAPVSEGRESMARV